MANYVIAPNMGFRDPTPGVETGPLYAQEIYDALLAIDSHDHTGGGTGGKQLTQAALNITGALSFAGNDATNLRTTRYQDQASSPSGVGDVDAVFFHNGDLWIVNGAGNAVQITNGTQINVATANTVYGSISVAGNKTILAGDTYVLLNVDTTAGRIITLPAANSVTPGRYYLVADASLLAATNAITINPAGADTINGGATYSHAITGGVVLLISDGASKWHALAFVTGVASSTSPGLLSPAFQALLAGATTAATASTLALRDGSGNLTAGVMLASRFDAPAAGSLFLGTINGTTVQVGQTGVGTVTNLRSETVNVIGSVGLAATSGAFSGTLGVTGASSLAALGLTGNITWGAAVAAPTIQQTQNASGAGALMTFSAQRGAAGFVGGVLSDGGGPGGTSGTNLPGDRQINLGVPVSSISAKLSLMVSGASIMDFNQSGAGTGIWACNLATFFIRSVPAGGLLAIQSVGSASSAILLDSHDIIIRDTAAVEAVRVTPAHTGASAILWATGVTSITDSQTVLASGTGASRSIASQAATVGTGGAFDIKTGAGGTASGLLRLLAGANVRFSANDTGIGLYSATPVAQAARPGQLTDSTAGTPGATLAAVVGTTYSTDIPTIRNWAASLAQRINAIELALHNLGAVA